MRNLLVIILGLASAILSSTSAFAQSSPDAAAPSKTIAPVLKKKVEPKYTKEAREKKIHGEVLLRVDVDEKGVPRDPKVTRGLGYGLDEKAVEAVKKWRFAPATRDGQPIKTLASISVKFSIYSRKPEEIKAALPDALGKVDAADAAARQEAQGLIEEAADLGMMDAQFFLGDAYDYGKHGMVEDKQSARRYLLACARQGDLRCRFRLGRLMLYWPGGQIAEYLEAYAWLQLAAEAGSKDAQTLLQLEPSHFSEQGEEALARVKQTLDRVAR